MTKVDGGQAFPSEFFETEHGDQVRPFSGSPGMTLRDYFAAKILSGMLSSDTAVAEIMLTVKHEGGNLHEKCTSMAYQFADAMLAEREKL